MEKILLFDSRLLSISLLLTIILDWIYPEHKGIMLKIHPVHTSYYLSLNLAKPYSSRWRGVAVWLFVVTVHIVPALFLMTISYKLSPILYIIISVVILKFSISLRLLLDICHQVLENVKHGDLDGARKYAQLIVRRDVYKLDEGRIISATLESLAESSVDGFISPLTYYSFLGPIGSLLQRIANTLDGSIGFKTPEFSKVGWFSAKADSLLNYIPARIAALLMVILAPTVGGSIKESFRVWRKWHNATESINAGHPMAAIAGVLRIRLEKVGHYIINMESRLPTSEDLAKGIRFMITVNFTYIMLIILLILLICP